MALDPVTAVLDIGGKLIDRLWPDPAQQDAAKLELMKMQMSGELQTMANDTVIAKAQTDVNAVEAASNNLFVSGAAHHHFVVHAARAVVVEVVDCHPLFFKINSCG